MADYKPFQKKRRKKKIHLFCTILTHSTHIICSLRMGQMGPKMTLGTLTLSGDDIPGV